MLVVEELLLDNGQMYEKVFFDGDKHRLAETIECCEMVSFTYVLKGKSKEINIRAALVISYVLDITGKANEPDKQSTPIDDGAKIIMFPTAECGPAKTPQLMTFEEFLTMIGAPKIKH